MVHQVDALPVALLAAIIQRDDTAADVGLEFLSAIQALLKSDGFLTTFWNNLLGDEVELVCEAFDQLRAPGTAGIAAVSLPGGVRT